MRYLRKYNEELKSTTYKSAADKLKKIGHPKRADKLNNWGDLVQIGETQALTKKRIKDASKLGTYKMRLVTQKYDSSTSTSTTTTILEGNFYIWFYIDDYNFSQNYNDWKIGEQGLFLQLMFGIIPADDETISKSLELLSESDFYLNTYYTNWMYINLSNSFDAQQTEYPILKPSGSVTFDSCDNYIGIFADRRSAFQFRSLLINIFSGKTIIDDTKECDIKEWIMTELCDERDRSLEEFESIVDSMKRININKLYKD